MQILLNESARFVSLVRANVLWAQIYCITAFMPIMAFHCLFHARNIESQPFTCFVCAFLAAVMVMAKVFYVFYLSSLHAKSRPRHIHVNDSGSVCFHCAIISLLFCQSIECKSIRGMYIFGVCMSVYVCAGTISRGQESTSALDYSQSENAEQRPQTGEQQEKRRTLLSREKRMHPNKLI